MRTYSKSYTVPRNELMAVATPAGTKSFHPVTHACLASLTEQYVEEAGFNIVNQIHTINAGGAQYFGRYHVHRNDLLATGDYALQIGIRNSHNKKFAAGLVIGAQVCVCSNLSFWGETKLARRHTTFIARDLPAMFDAAMERLMLAKQTQDNRFDAYKATPVSDDRAARVLIEGADRGAIATTRIPDVWKAWMEPPHAEFEPRTAWSLFNAFTEVYKQLNEADILRRSRYLHMLVDDVVDGRVVATAG